jgi:hypothetical protein
MKWNLRLTAANTLLGPEPEMGPGHRLISRSEPQ